MKLVAIGVGLAVGFGLVGVAQAQPLTPDYAQAPNGTGELGDPVLTPGFSPIQVPAPEVERGPDTTTVRAHPYLAPWAHDLIPVAPNTAFEIQGAARVTVPGTDGRTLVLNPNGHCLFEGAGARPAELDATALRPIQVRTPVFELVVEPTLYR